jgi:hypothetical protein
MFDMSQQEVINKLVELKNQGIKVHLTDEGWSVVVRLMGAVAEENSVDVEKYVG